MDVATIQAHKGPSFLVTPGTRSSTFRHVRYGSPGGRWRPTDVLPKGPLKDVLRRRPEGRQRVLAVATDTAIVASEAVASTSFNQLFAVSLGYACIVGSCFRSVPQIVKVFQSRSAEGLSLTANVVELICYTIIVAYNIQQGYPFSTYGETWACWLQDVVLIGMIYQYMKTGWQTVVLSSVGFLVLCVVLFSGGCPVEVLGVLQLSTIVVMALGSKLPQIMLNIQRGNSGVLSLTTCLLNVLGCIIRVYTTAVLTQDALIFWGSLIQLVLNGILLYQTIVTFLVVSSGHKKPQATDGGDLLGPGLQPAA